MNLGSAGRAATGQDSRTPRPSPTTRRSHEPLRLGVSRRAPTPRAQGPRLRGCAAVAPRSTTPSASGLPDPRRPEGRDDVVVLTARRAPIGPPGDEEGGALLRPASARRRVVPRSLPEQGRTRAGGGTDRPIAHRRSVALLPLPSGGT